MDRAPRSRPFARRLRTAGVALLVLAPVAAVASSVGAPPAHAATPGSYLVTFVARSCPTYLDVTANLARNNIQESLQDLGGNTLYTSGQPINPVTEQQGQPLNNPCTALPGWQFTFGNGINGHTPQTNLSKVSNPVSPPFTTQASVPLLDANGNPTGANITGAVTTTLTAAQVTQASNHQLWVQGGTPTDPLGSATFGAGKYGFAALRCAIDNLNGDNVEWVGFPSGQSHVFCYYYAVTPPLPAATVTIVKQLGQNAVSPEVFHFRGSISYNSPNGDFEASTANPMTFVRASQTPWNFREMVGPTLAHPQDPADLASPDFTFQTVTCHSTLGTSTINDVSFNSQAHPADYSSTDPEVTNLVPGAGDQVTCTYRNDPNVTVLSVFKQTTGGFGGPFVVNVTPPVGTPATPVPPPWNVTTDVSDVPVLAGNFQDHVTQPNVQYLITEQVPAATPAGSWTPLGLECNGVPQTPVTPGDLTSFSVTVLQSIQQYTPMDCLFTNAFQPLGSITLTKTTVGGVGTTNFVVSPVPSPNIPDDVVDPTLRQSATTTQSGVAVTATGDPLTQLPVGTGQAPQKYLIAEEGPTDTAGGSWSPQPITCNGGSPVTQGAEVEIQLSPSAPSVSCGFTNAFTVTPPSPTTTTTTGAPATSTTSTVPGGVAADSTGQSGGGLAMTGEDVRLPIGIAGGLALAGATLLLVDRARRRTVPVAADRRDPPLQD